MKYLTIKVGRSLNPITGEEWVKLDCEVSVGEGENPYDVFQKVMADNNQWLPNPHKSTYHADQETLPSYPMKIERTNESPEVGMLNAINSCTDITVLETFKLLVTKNPQFKEAYDKKYQSLTK